MKCDKCNKEMEPDHHICELAETQNEKEDDKKEKILLNFDDVLWGMLSNISDKKSD